MAKALREPDTGEQFLEAADRATIAAVLRQSSSGIGDDAVDEYWKAYADSERRRGHLELYRSGDFAKLDRFEGRLAALGVPALLVWGAGDPFAPVAGAHRFACELSDTELVVIEDAGHFVWEDAPVRCGEAVTAFLAARL